jgi:pilus assembly protein Flp/PilA
MAHFVRDTIPRLIKDESGATAVEYGLIAAVVCVGIIVGLGGVRDGLNSIFNNVKAELSK